MWFWLDNVLFFIEGGSIVSFLLLAAAAIFLGSSEILFHVISFLLLILKYLIPILSLICGFSCLWEESWFTKIFGFVDSIIVAIIIYKFFSEYNLSIAHAFLVSRSEYVVEIVLGFFMWVGMSMCGLFSIYQLAELDDYSVFTKIKAFVKSYLLLIVTYGIYGLLLYLNS